MGKLGKNDEWYGWFNETQYAVAPSGRILRIIANTMDVAHGWQVIALSGRQRVVRPEGATIR